MLLNQQGYTVAAALDRDFSPKPSEVTDWNDGEPMEVTALIYDSTPVSSSPVLKKKYSYSCE